MALILFTLIPAGVVLSFAEVAAFYGVFPIIEKSWRMRALPRIAIAVPISALLVALIFFCGSWVESRWKGPGRSSGPWHGDETLFWSSLLTMALFALSGLCYVVLGLRHQTLNRVIVVTATVTAVAGWPLGLLTMIFIAFS